MLSLFLPGAVSDHLSLTLQASQELFLEIQIKTAILAEAISSLAG